MQKTLRQKQAVSEVLSVVLLLGITLALFGLLNYIVFSYSIEPPQPSVNLVGSINTKKQNITIEHNGGKTLDGKTQIIITIGSTTVTHDANDLLNDINNDGKWNFGESINYHYTGNIANSYVQTLVMDPSKNTLLLSVVLQQGV